MKNEKEGKKEIEPFFLSKQNYMIDATSTRIATIANERMYKKHLSNDHHLSITIS